MAFEPPHMPERDEIYNRALEIFHMEHPGAPTPEEDELKEGSYWQRATTDLMSGFRSQFEGYLHFLEDETKRIRETLGEKIEVTPEEVRDLQDTITDFRSKYRKAKQDLKEAEEQVGRYEEAERKRREEVVEVERVEAEAHRIPADVNVYRDKPGDYRVEFMLKGETGRPIMFTGEQPIPEVEKIVATHEELYDTSELEQFKGEDWYEALPETLKTSGMVVWTDDQVTWDPEAAKDREIYHYEYTRDYLEGLTVEDLHNIARVKNVKTVGKKEDLIANILGEEKPPAPPPPEVAGEVPPAPVPERKAPPRRVEKPPPEMPLTGLWKPDEDLLRSVFLDRLLTGAVPYDPTRYLPSFRVAFAESREAVKDLPHDLALEDAKSAVLAKADQLIGAIKPRGMPGVAAGPTTVVQVQMPTELPPREANYEIRTCWVYNCGNSFSQDIDLEMRLRSPYRGPGGGAGGYKPGVLGHMPEEFFHLCEEHLMIKYSYFSMKDAVAFRLADRSKPNVGLTILDLRIIGLNDVDLDTIVVRAEQYGYQP